MCRGGMETKPLRDQPNIGRMGIKFNACEITGALKVAFALMAPDAQPVVDRLDRHLDV